MDRLYVYHGIVSSMESYGSPRKDIVIVLRSPAYEIAPTMLNVYGSLAEYIKKIENTDAEERYLYADYYFDATMRLCRIVIPGDTPSVPAKVIAQSPDILSDYLEFFGSKGYITTDKPQSMSQEELCTWYDWRSAH